LSVVKSKVKNISASGVSVISDTDIANARIEFENGCVANLTSRISMKNMRKSFFPKDAYISVDFWKRNVKW
jgi:hypothetical protein